jgi:hypothetical protein
MVWLPCLAIAAHRQCRNVRKTCYTCHCNCSKCSSPLLHIKEWVKKLAEPTPTSVASVAGQKYSKIVKVCYTSTICKSRSGGTRGRASVAEISDFATPLPCYTCYTALNSLYKRACVCSSPLLHLLHLPERSSHASRYQLS